MCLCVCVKEVELVVQSSEVKINAYRFPLPSSPFLASSSLEYFTPIFTRLVDFLVVVVDLLLLLLLCTAVVVVEPAAGVDLLIIILVDSECCSFCRPEATN